MATWWQRWTHASRESEDRRRAARASAKLGVYSTGATMTAVADSLWIETTDTTRYLVAALLGLLVWRATRAAADVLHVTMRHRTDPGTAGLVEFLVRFGGFLASVGFVLHALGLEPRSLLLGGAITAGFFILTAREPLQNLVAGLMLATARPFRVGDTIRLQGGGLAGTFEGEVLQLGLMYTVFNAGERTTMMPNNLLVTSSVTPLDELPVVDFEATLRPGMTPRLVQRVLHERINVPLAADVVVNLKNVDEQLTVHISATPTDPSEGAALADEILDAISPMISQRDPLATAEFDAIVPNPPTREQLIAAERERNGEPLQQTDEHEAIPTPVPSKSPRGTLRSDLERTGVEAPSMRVDRPTRIDGLARTEEYPTV